MIFFKKGKKREKITVCKIGNKPFFPFVMLTVATCVPLRSRARLTSRKWWPWSRIGSASFTMRCGATPAVYSAEIRTTCASFGWPLSGSTTTLPQRSTRLWRLVESAVHPCLSRVTECTSRILCSFLWHLFPSPWQWIMLCLYHT